jgi:hypothetical protein
MNSDGFLLAVRGFRWFNQALTWSGERAGNER